MVPIMKGNAAASGLHTPRPPILQHVEKGVAQDARASSSGALAGHMLEGWPMRVKTKNG